MNILRRRAPDAPPANVVNKIRQWKTKPTRPPVDLMGSGMGVAEQRLIISLATAGIMGVATAGVVSSYSHMYDWAIANGEPSWRAKLFPISVDGAMVAGSALIYVDTRLGLKRDWAAYLMVTAGVGWSVMANVAHGWVDPIAAKMIAGWPALVVGAVVELGRRFMQRLRSHADEKRRAALRAARRAAQSPAPPIEIEAELVEPPKALRPRANEAEASPDRPWLAEPNVQKAMFAYLDLKPTATGAELDREVGAIFGAAKDYGRKIKRQYEAEHQS